MTEKKTFDLTQEGLDQVKAELDKLRLEDRPRIIQAIKDARAQGDLSENAEYDAARDEQAKTEARIKELEYIVENANVVKASKSKVGIGSTVTVLYIDDDEEEEYKMVGLKLILITIRFLKILQLEKQSLDAKLEKLFQLKLQMVHMI